MDDKYMIVGIDKAKRNSNYAWVSFANLQCRDFIKELIDLSKNEQIKYGTVGIFDKNQVFHAQQNHFDQNYSVAKVLSIEKKDWFGRSLYMYDVGLSQGDFDKILVDSTFAKLATVGNHLLVHHGKYIMNLTAVENCWNLLHHYKVKKYGLHPSYCGSKVAHKHNFNAYKNNNGELVMPAVVTECCNDYAFRVFVPQSENRNHYRDIHIVIEGVYLPLPRPSDVVLLNQTKDKDKFALKDNLTMNMELQSMKNNFGFPQYKVAVLEQIKNIKTR